MLRVGLVGCSGHAGYVALGIREIEDACLCAVAPGCPEEDMSALLASPEIARCKPAVHQDYRKMLDQEHLDIVGVSPFYYLHSAVCLDALKRGVAPFCEKPLALDLQSLDALRNEQQKARLPVGMMLSFRYEAIFHTARKLVQSGVIGEVTLGHAQKSYKLGVRRPAFYRKRETSGGLIPWVGIHAIDWFRWVSGRRYSSVTAHHKNQFTSACPGMEDHASCLFQLDNGGSATMSFDFLRPSGAASHGDDRLRLVGSKGFLEIRFPDVFEVCTDRGLLSVTLESPRSGMFADFARRLQDHHHPALITTEDAFTLTELALKTREAADLATTVKLEE
ncbi:MAG: Gfo/Idh/MocA family oxidoreductase [Verrucomicrobiae bacterium]|nr:Gfo/Idh/MocA family oxidoreductase [Verrucomicrobiae bacterium]